MTLKSFAVTLAGGATASAVRIAPGASLAGLADALALPPRRGSVALVGGAKGLDAPAYRSVRTQLARLLAELSDEADEKQLAVVDGGTPYGVMRLLGEARARRKRRFPLVGVAPLDKVTWADRPSGEGGGTALDANHNAFVLVETTDWGGETDTLAQVVHALAGGQPTLELLVNGGDVTRHDAWAYLQLGGTLLTLEGSGRFADQVAQALKRGQSDDPIVQSILDTGRVHTFPLRVQPGQLTARLAELLGW